VATLSSLRDRFLADTAFGGPGATPALVRALDAIGWRAVRESSAELLANDVVVLIEDCVRGHQDLSQLTFALAGMLRDGGPLLDGGLPPVEAYWPAAEEILTRYVRDSGGGDGSAAGYGAEAFFS
jgi:hypothetical protein